ncbi:hypothetical protein C6P42_004553, partial [Pichia californica]
STSSVLLTPISILPTITGSWSGEPVWDIIIPQAYMVESLSIELTSDTKYNAQLDNYVFATGGLDDFTDISENLYTATSDTLQFTGTIDAPYIKISFSGVPVNSLVSYYAGFSLSLNLDYSNTLVKRDIL